MPYVLIDEQYAYVFPMLRELIECLFNGGCFGFGVDNEEILLSIGRLSDML